MAKNQRQKKKPAAEAAPPRPKEFLDLIAPAAVKFNTDHYIMGGTYRSVMALRTYPPVTEELALLRRLGEMEGVTLHLSTREVTAAEENAILHAAANKTRMERSNLNNMKQSVTAASFRTRKNSSGACAGIRSRWSTVRCFWSSRPNLWTSCGG